MFAIIVSRAIFLALFFFLFFFAGDEFEERRKGLKCWKRSSLGLYSMDYGMLACKCFSTFSRVIYIFRRNLF